jgi:alpha-beta hydrolase superfamily lysophospholipase
MIPVYISGCFGVLHAGSSNRAALICGSLSDEALNSYRPLVFLAEQLAAAEIPTLRLAYYGTGDSAGEDDEANRFDRWLDSISAAVAWLCEHCGVGAVTLIGHRIGASLAARAACDIDAVDSLVLVAPSSGRQLLHELTLSARIAQRVWQTNQPVDDGNWFESHGLRINRATRDALNALDIRKLPCPPAAQALLLDSADHPAARNLVQALQGIGTTTSLEVCEDLDRMQRDSSDAEVPYVAFGRIVGWTQSLPSQPGTCRVQPFNCSATLEIGLAREMPIRFGPDRALFGILSMPAWPRPDSPAVLLINTSANPRWGNARIAVDIARSLAADGIASLRMDGSGMGDTAPQTGETGKPYSEVVTRDVQHAVEELAQRSQQSVVLLGACSGAYHALETAYRDAKVGGLILVNLQRFVWREGDPSDIVRRSALRPTRFYLRNILRAQAWLRLLRADFDVANMVRVFAARLLRRALADIDPVLNLLSRRPTQVRQVRQAVAAIERRGVPMLYVLGKNDPGVEELAEYFGRDGWRLRRQRNVTVRLLEGADHTLGAHSVRAVLVQEIRDWCRGRLRMPKQETQRVAAETPRCPRSMFAPVRSLQATGSASRK